MPEDLTLPSSHRLKSGASTPMKAAGRVLRMSCSNLRRMPARAWKRPIASE